MSGHGATRYERLLAGEEMEYQCACGRPCPVRYDWARGTLVVDHGGEAVYLLPPEELPQPGVASYRLLGTSLMGWLDRVHAYERAGR